MNNLTVVLDYFDILLESAPQEAPSEVMEAYNALRNQPEKPLFTETGLQILEYLQAHPEDKLKAKDIANGLEESSRKISGAMRKLVSDGYVDKFGNNPVTYSLTEKGKDFDIKDKGDN